MQCSQSRRWQLVNKTGNEHTSDEVHQYNNKIKVMSIVKKSTVYTRLLLTLQILSGFSQFLHEFLDDRSRRFVWLGRLQPSNVY